jgi:hypothetical protein
MFELASLLQLAQNTSVRRDSVRSMLQRGPAMQERSKLPGVVLLHDRHCEPTMRWRAPLQS